jgi:hypothetical protein
LSLDWLRRFAADSEVVSAFEVLRRRDFDPPRPVVLPRGNPLEVWQALEARAPEELAALAAALVDLPAPGSEAAGPTLELFLHAPGEASRAQVLLRSLEAVAPTGLVALWRLRLDLALDRLPPETEAWEARLTGFPADSGWPLATALRMAACAIAHGSDPHGAAWLVPALGGRRLLNAEIARIRRPALVHELGPVYPWLERAEVLSPGRAEGGVDGLCSAAAAADAKGDPEEGSRLGLRTLSRHGDRTDLARAMALRAEILLDPALSDSVALASTGAGGDISSLARRPIAPPTPPVHEAPRVGWSARIAAGRDGGMERQPELAFLEAAGSQARALRGWLQQPGAGDLLQAARIARELGDAGLAAEVRDALEARVTDDETLLAANPTERDLARALWHLERDERKRWLLHLRLAALEPPEGATTVAPTEDPDDPHSLTNRLAAAADLVEAGLGEAATAILVSLLRRERKDTAPPEGFVARLLGLTTKLLRLESPPLALLSAVERVLLETSPLSQALERTLLQDPAAAYPCHQALRKAALEANAPDQRRMTWLMIWLAIWRATGTPPTPAALRPFLANQAGLMALAAARLTGTPDPVEAASDFLATHPPSTTPAEDWSRLLLG